MKLSVIVPVYNVESYLKQCVESILNQRNCQFELLLIDDGSTDGSSELCDRYAAEYDVVKAFHKPNGGLSDARNFGMEKADGAYLVFVDSDDWIEAGALEAISKELEKRQPDVLLTRLIEDHQGALDYRDAGIAEIAGNCTRTEAVKWLMEQSENTWPAVTKIVSKRLVDQHDLRFMKGKRHEDLDWTCNLCYYAQTVCAADLAWYDHRMERQGSIGNTISGKNITDVIEMAGIHFDRFQENQDEISRLVMNRVMRSVYSSINKIKQCTKEDRDAVIRCMKEHMRIFAITPSLKAKLFVTCMKTLSVEGALRIIG